MLKSALTLVLAASTGFAQQASMPGMNMPMPETRPIPSPDQLPVPIRMSGLGNSHIAIKALPEAQAWFDQGLNLLHDFWDYESAKAFEQSIRVDPSCAMCFWGLAQAEGFRGGDDKSYGAQALAEAVRLKGKAGSADKLYIEAAEAASKSKADSKAQVEILRKLVKKHPEDVQAHIFLAMALQDGYDDKGEPKPGTKEVIDILSGILRDHPDDSAANHYWIHAIEPGNHPEQAIPSSQRLASLAPTSGHMVHMPGHIFYRVGDYSQADRWFAASTAADEAYMQAQHVAVDDDWNYVHNMMYAIANLMEQGRLANANALSDRLANARGELSATLYIWSTRDQVARLSNRLPVALRTADWPGVQAMLDQAKIAETDKTKNLRFLAAELHDFAAGMAALDAHDLPAAEAASARLDAGLWRQDQEANHKSMDSMKPAAAPAKPDAPKEAKAPTTPVLPDAAAGPLVKSLSVASQELRAGIFAAKGNLPAAKKLYETAAKDEKSLGYHEPPLYIRPVAETEAAALLAARDYAGAKSAYTAALVERPHSGFGLYGLARVQELSGDPEAARSAYQAFLSAWPAADATLPEVAHAREVLAVPALATR